MQAVMPQTKSAKLTLLKDEALSQTFDTLEEYISQLSQYAKDNPGDLWIATGLAGIACSSAFSRTVNKVPPSLMMTLASLFACFCDGGTSPVSILFYRAMLFPDGESYVKTISPEAFKWLQGEAKAFLAKYAVGEMLATPETVAHWESIVEGKAPFGLRYSNQVYPYT